MTSFPTISRAIVFSVFLSMALFSVGIGHASQPLEGEWLGAIELPDASLTVVVRLEEADGVWQGAADLPQQGAFGIPLSGIVVDVDHLKFTLAGVPGDPTFEGTLTDEKIEGTFTQSGFAFPFAIARDVNGQPDSPTAPSEYVDPAGRFSFPIPTNWTVSDAGGYAVVTDPEGGISIAALALSTEGAESAVREAWELVDPALDLEESTVLEPPSQAGVERTVVVNYRSKDDRIFQALAQVHDGTVYILLIDAEISALQRRNAQLQIVATGFKILALDEDDLSNAEPLAAVEVLEEFESFVAQNLEAFDIPGAAVAIVQGGKTVYLNGFGVTEAGGDRPVTPDTQMMIGSTGKTMTTLLLATLVDEGVIDWDTPVIEVLPEFAVADPELSRQITIKNLVCACTGVPRRDLELTFLADQLTAEDVVRSLETFQFFTGFGEAFHYSNQLVATAGYAAASAVGSPFGALYEGYEQLIHERVFDPVGMADTTLSFEQVKERGDYGIPHQYDFGSDGYVSIDVDAERMLSPVAPAGAHWSTAKDLANYMITQLAAGLAPSGTRVVSEQNLRATWEPQVAMTATDSYGLGWMVGTYKGVPVIYHGGNTLGFTSDFAFWPSLDLGVLVVTNAQGSNAFNELVRVRLFELVFGLDAESERAIAFLLEQQDEAIARLKSQIQDSVNVDEVREYLGKYTNAELGEILLELDGERLIFDAGWFRTEARPIFDSLGEPNGYFTYDPPVIGLTFELLKDDEGSRIVRIGEGVVSYEFVEIE